MYINRVLSRRKLWMSIGIGSMLAYSSRFSRAQSLVGFNPLISPSIPAKSPAEVLLIAITQTSKQRIVAAGEHGVIVYSDDFGKNWTQAQVPVDVTITCVAFSTPLLGWAAGHFGVILNTKDGGKTWVKQLDGIQANQLTLAAAQGVVVQNNPCPCAENALRRADFFMKGGPDKPFLSMLVFSDQEVIAFGAYRLAMRTVDGGKNWSDWSLHIYDKLSHNIYDSAVVDGNYYLTAEQGLVFSSTDQGNTFLPVAPTSDTTLFGIVGGLDNSLIVYGVAGTVFRSTDTGKSWDRITLSSQDNITSGCCLKSGDILIATEAGALFKSTDNGSSFTEIPGIPAVPIFGILDMSAGGLITCGADGISKISKNIFS